MVTATYPDVLNFWLNFEHLSNDIESVQTYIDQKGTVHSYERCLEPGHTSEVTLSLNALSASKLCPLCSSNFRFVSYYLEAAILETSLSKCAALISETEKVFKQQEYLTLEKAVKFLHNLPVNPFLTNIPVFFRGESLKEVFKDYTIYFNERLETLQNEALTFLRSDACRKIIKTFYMRRTLQNFSLQHFDLFDTESKIYLSFAENLQETVFNDSSMKLTKVKETFTKENLFKSLSVIDNGSKLYLLATFYSYVFEKRKIVTLPPIVYKSCKEHFEEAINIPEEPGVGVLEIMETLLKENESLSFENAYEIAVTI